MAFAESIHAGPVKVSGGSQRFWAEQLVDPVWSIIAKEGTCESGSKSLFGTKGYLLGKDSFCDFAEQPLFCQATHLERGVQSHTEIQYVLVQKWWPGFDRMVHGAAVPFSGQQ